MEILQMPSWYWKNNLHDTVIKNISFISLQYDFTQKNPIRNYLQLDASNALFDSSIKSIKFFNAKRLSGFKDYKGWWWVSDSLEIVRSKYVLKINLATKMQEEEVILQFDDAEIERIK